MSKVDMLNSVFEVFRIVGENMVLEHGAKVETHDGPWIRYAKTQGLLVEEMEMRL